MTEDDNFQYDSKTTFYFQSTDVVFEEYKPYDHQQLSSSPEKKLHARNANNNEGGHHHHNNNKPQDDDLIFEDDISSHKNNADPVKSTKKGYLHSLKSRLTRPRKANDTDMFLSGMQLYLLIMFALN